LLTPFQIKIWNLWSIIHWSLLASIIIVIIIANIFL
jgi:hypothetical protein